MRAPPIVVVVSLLSSVAFAAPPPLAPHAGKGLTVSLPKGWAVSQQQDTLIAQQDPKKGDAPTVLFVYSPIGAGATEDQLLDATVAPISKDLKIATRAAISAEHGHFLIGDGTVDGVTERVGALAVVSNGKAVVAVLIAKAAEFDALGGVTLLALVEASLKLEEPSAPVAAAPAAPTGGRHLTLADFAGDWAEESGSVKGLYSSGRYTGYVSTQTAAHRVFDRAGHFTLRGSYASSVNGSVMAGSTNERGTITITAGNVLIMKLDRWQNPEYFYIRAWDEKPDATILTLNGHYNSEADALEAANPNVATNLNNTWVRKH